MTVLAQVIGFGPTALGLPVAADRMGLLPVVSVEGLGFVDGHVGPLRGVYGVGIGFARPDSRGERRVGLDIFHGLDAEEILRGLAQPVTTFPKGGNDVQSSW